VDDAIALIDRADAPPAGPQPLKTGAERGPNGSDAVHTTPGPIAGVADATSFQARPKEPTLSGIRLDQSTAGGPPIGALIRNGGNGAAGSIGDAAASSVLHSEIAKSAFSAGFNLAEAYYLAMPYLSWHTIVVGDPLYAPFQKHALARSEIERVDDSQPELPAAFAKRRLVFLKQEHQWVSERALILSMRCRV